MCAPSSHAKQGQQKPLSFSVTDIKGCVLLSYPVTLVFGLVLASDKLDRKISSVAKLFSDQSDRSDVFRSIK